MRTTSTYTAEMKRDLNPVESQLEQQQMEKKTLQNDNDAPLVEGKTRPEETKRVSKEEKKSENTNTRSFWKSVFSKDKKKRKNKATEALEEVKDMDEDKEEPDKRMKKEENTNISSRSSWTSVFKRDKNKRKKKGKEEAKKVLAEDAGEDKESRKSPNEKILQMKGRKLSQMETLEEVEENKEEQDRQELTEPVRKDMDEERKDMEEEKKDMEGEERKNMEQEESEVMEDLCYFLLPAILTFLPILFLVYLYFSVNVVQLELPVEVFEPVQHEEEEYSITTKLFLLVLSSVVGCFGYNRYNN